MVRLTWLRRASRSRHRTPGHKQAPRERFRRIYRPHAECLEDRTVLSTPAFVPVGTLAGPPLAAVNGIASLARNTGPGVAAPKSAGNRAPGAVQRLPDLTALLFATEAPELPAIRLPPPPVPLGAVLPLPRIGVYAVPPAAQATWRGPNGGIVPEASRAGDSYQVFFPPSDLLQATVGEAFAGEVATVTASGESKPGARYQATIDWGDGTPATSGVIHVVGKHVAVDGRHTFTNPGHFTVQVHIEADGTVLGNVKGTATVAPAATAEPPTIEKPVPDLQLGPTSMRSIDANKWSTVVMAATTFALAPQATWPARRSNRVLERFSERGPSAP
jgi:hypothetical protein